MPHHSTGLGPGYGGLKCTFTLSADVRYTGPLDVQEEKEFEEKVKSAKAGMDGGLISVGEGSHRGCDLGVDGGVPVGLRERRERLSGLALGLEPGELVLAGVSDVVVVSALVSAWRIRRRSASTQVLIARSTQCVGLLG